MTIRMRIGQLLLVLGFALTGAGRAVGETVYFETNFDDGGVPIDTPSPVWSLSSSLSNVYGPGNNFVVTGATTHSGSYALRMDYGGRNGFCNTCGVSTVTALEGLDGVLYLVAGKGEDLAAEPYNAAPGRTVYNKTNGFSKWQIVTVENANTVNDKLTLRLVAAGINGETPEFNGGDEIKIARLCGVDGTIGGEIDRRSDCDGLITYFKNVNGSQVPGQSVFRRMYIKQVIDVPAYHQKLRYWSFGDGDFIVHGEHEDGGKVHPLVVGLGKYGAAVVYRPGQGLPDGLLFEKDVWYYVEEEIRPESATGAADGLYRLWFAKAGEETATPLLELLNLTLPLMERTTLWGNHQHTVDCVGYWYLDDIKISDSRVGSTDANGVNRSPPASPSGLRVE